MFWYVLVCSNIYCISKAVQPMKGTCCIMVFDALTHALLLSMCDLKMAQMNMQCILIWELMLYKFHLGHNATEVIKKHFLCKKDYN